MKKDKLIEKSFNLKQLAIGMFSYNAASIFGPLITFLLIGFVLDKIFHTKPIFMIVGVILAFIITNVLILIRTRRLIKEFNKTYSQNKENQESENQK